MSSMTTRARKLLAEARNFIESGEEANWAAAERMWQANKEEGITQREIGDAVGKSHTTIGRYIAIWAKHGGTAPGSRPGWTEAIEGEVGKTMSDVRSESLTKQPQQIVEAITKAPAESRKAIFEAITKEQALNQEMEAVQLKHWAKAADKAKDIGRENDPPGTIYPGDFFFGYARLGAAEEKLREALESLRRTDLDDEHRGMIITKVKNLRLLLDWLDSYAESGHGDAAELDALLGGEIS